MLSEGDPLLQQSQHHRILRYNARRRQRRNCLLLTIGAVVLFGCFGFLVHLRNSSSSGTISISSIVGRARQAKSMVNIDPKSGVYSVDFDASPTKIVPSETTFAELAEICLLPWYEASIMSVTSDPAWDGDGISPSNIGEVRRSLLMTRDMLDIFGPVFPDTPFPPVSILKKKKKKDSTKDRSLWRKLRKQYRDGYQKMGFLKDLDGLTYSQALLKERVDDVMKWKADFMNFQKHNRVRNFLYTKSIAKGGGIDPVGCYQHKSSHLFWAELEQIPCGNDNGTGSLQMIGSVQLDHSRSFLTEIKNYTTVIPESHEIEFHNLRKELRIFVDEYNLFGKILVPSTLSGWKISTSDHMNTIAGTATFDSNTTGTDDDEQLKVELTTLNKAQKMLGKINDKWTAREIYIKDGTHPNKLKTLERKTDTKWKEFLVWQEENKLDECITNVLNRMKEVV